LGQPHAEEREDEPEENQADDAEDGTAAELGEHDEGP
jgi:hypothetical protein